MLQGPQRARAQPCRCALWMRLRGGLLGSRGERFPSRSFGCPSLSEGDEQRETMQTRAVQLPEGIREREYRIGGTLGARNGL